MKRIALLAALSCCLISCASSQPHDHDKVVCLVRLFTTDQKQVKNVDVRLGRQCEINLMNGRVLRVLVTQEDGQLQTYVDEKKIPCRFGHYTTIYSDDRCVAQVFAGHNNRIPAEF